MRPSQRQRQQGGSRALPAAICMLSLTLVSLTGCLVRHRRIDRTGHSNAPLLTADLDQLAETLRQRYQAIETLNATVDLEPTVLSQSKGEIAEYKDVRGYILIRDRKSTRLNSSHIQKSRMPSSA